MMPNLTLTNIVLLLGTIRLGVFVLDYTNDIIDMMKKKLAIAMRSKEGRHVDWYMYMYRYVHSLHVHMMYVLFVPFHGSLLPTTTCIKKLEVSTSTSTF